MNLRIKFTFSASLLLLIVIFFVSYTIFSAQRKFLTNQFEENRDRTYKVLYYSCEEALKSNEEEQLKSLLDSTVSIHKPSIVYAAYVSGYKQVFSSRDDKNIASAFTARVKKAYSPKTDIYESLTAETVYEYASPILSGEKYLGTLIVGFSHDYMQAGIQKGTSLISHNIKKAALIAFILGILGANFMAFRLIQPIRLLAEAAKRIADGDQDVQVEIKRSDELGLLAKTFNEMAVKVQETDKLKDGFVSSVSHELRSPLAAIEGYCNLLIEGVHNNHPAEQQLRGLTIIKDATLRLTNFINNILDLAKMKAGKFEMKPGPIFIDETIQEITRLFESLALSQNKTLKSIIKEDLPPVFGDAEKIKQVITNLVSNALKFTKENDSIVISAMVSKSYGPDFVEVWVEDSGIGLTKEEAEKVFEKFYQVKDGEFKKPKGTGLGLSIVYEIIKLHHGRIWAEGNLGKGATFKFVLPVNK